MSKSFRAVTETFSEASSCFLSPDELADFLIDLANLHELNGAGPHEYGDYITLWIEKGKEFVDLISQKTYELPEDAKRFDADDLRALLGNMRSLASEWSERIDLDDGSLIFYIDAY